MRARTLAESWNLDLRGFEDLSSLALESLYPNCAESLRQQLAESMTDRYAKLQYHNHQISNQADERSALSTAAQKVEQTEPDPPVKSGSEGRRNQVLIESLSDLGRVEPPIPRLEGDKLHRKCEWCFGILDTTMFREANGRCRWSRKGRCVLACSSRLEHLSTALALTFAHFSGSTTATIFSPTFASQNPVQSHSVQKTSGQIT